MAVIQAEIEQRLQEATLTHLPDADRSRVLVRPCADPQHGDYQSNALMGLAKQRKMNPRQLAEQVVQSLDVADWCEPVEIAGPGFLNFRLKPDALQQALRSALKSDCPFVDSAKSPRTVVVDFSSPNVAKPMHVGHIRSTILGDTVARVLRMLGHRVVTDNHIGDWGTQFGMLLLGWKTELDEAALEQDPIAELERLYKTINADESCRDEARAELVKLQAGDEENLAIWQRMIALSQVQFDHVYGRLGVTFDETLGESFYNPHLSELTEELQEKGIAEESEGALVVRFSGDKQLADKPAIVRKRDGAANYTTTDLATLRYRMEAWQPTDIVYVTDGRQQLHFQQLFKIFGRWQDAVSVKLEHVWFGSILGPDGKPFKTRSGDTVRLADLLDEAEERAFTVVSEKNPDLSDDERRAIARVVGLGALKYADLSNNRQSDYIFDWDKMLAFQGNTAPYLQYAYTRVRSIFRKMDAPNFATVELQLKAPEELALAKHLMNFGQTLEMVAQDYRPNFLCNYLFELAGHFSRFYEACPVLKAEEAERNSRLAICELTARVLRSGLDAMGIEVTEVM
ncbi:MAG: arginine--tRNA ligase [Limisphaerales bacterium]|nr:MAG: arginine--tRNA ligase [Limisphaerales bacterium]